jgi:metallo-beta-lactamase family protein
VVATFHEAGHILGSAMIAFDVRMDGQQRRIIFTGDIGRWDRPIVRNPSTFEQADYVVMESTYGNRTHADVKAVV